MIHVPASSTISYVLPWVVPVVTIRKCESHWLLYVRYATSGYHHLLLCRQALVDVVSGCMLATVQYRLSLLGQLLLCDVRF